MNEKELNEWWNQLELNQLLRVFHCPAGMEYNDFIDALDDWWDTFPLEKKRGFYDCFNEKLA